MNFTVYGHPAPQGSKRAFVNKRTGKVALVESSSKVRPWRQDVKCAAIEWLPGGAESSWQTDPIQGPVRVIIHFMFLKPKSAKKAVRHPSNRGSGDLDKLVRSTLDGLTEAGVWRDDAQVCELWTTKSFSQREGAQIVVEELP